MEGNVDPRQIGFRRISRGTPIAKRKPTDSAYSFAGGFHERDCLDHPHAGRETLLPFDKHRLELAKVDRIGMHINAPRSD
jgi:hypothetical protein